MTEPELRVVVTSSIGMRWAVAGPFRTFHLGRGPSGLPDFFQVGKRLEESWGRLGAPHLEPTVVLLSEQAQRFGGHRRRALAAKGDTAQIALMCAVGEMSRPVREDRKERI